MEVQGFFFILLGIALYFLPTIIAWNKSYILAIFLINILVGWTILGWIILLIVAFIKSPQKQIYWHHTVPAADTKTNYEDVYAAIEKLSNLHKNGIITDAEFAEQKHKLLNK
ncbi:MAG TPA: superinfection immunity protein [Bacteroidia bacterium]|jgi:hypothetical protein|nr:superinfection immunity protein [Bacteroidia bacterium]